MRVVVFCPNLIGDTVMAGPTLRALRARFPGATIHGVIKPHVSPTLDGCPWLDDRILFNPKSKRAEHRTPQVIRSLRRGRYDLAVLLPNSFRSALMAYLGGVPRRVGYVRGGRGLLLTEGPKPPVDENGRYVPTPIVEYYLALARALDCPVDSTKLELWTTTEDENHADSAWSDLRLDQADEVVCLNTGGAFGPAKNWPTESFAELAKGLVATPGRSVLVVCGPGEAANAREIVARAGHPRVVGLADRAMSIGLTKACIRRAALLVTTDSGPRHFAAAFGVPVVGLFGPTHIAWTRTYHPRAVHLRVPVPCGPCQKGVCGEGHHRCMRDLTPASVLSAAERLLGAGRIVPGLHSTSAKRHA